MFVVSLLACCGCVRVVVDGYGWLLMVVGGCG